MNNIKISVAITAYKRPKMIEDLIKSFRIQNVKEAELLIIDDCVDDKSVMEIVSKYQIIDSRIRFIKNEVNLGYCKNYLKSLTEARGKYIITMGDDDIFLSKRVLEKYIDIFEKNKDVNYIYSNMIQFNQYYKIGYVSNIFVKCKAFEKLEES